MSKSSLSAKRDLSKRLTNAGLRYTSLSAIGSKGNTIIKVLGSATWLTYERNLFRECAGEVSGKGYTALTERPVI